VDRGKGAAVAADGGIQIIVNPISGRGAARRVLGELNGLLSLAAIAVKRDLTSGPGHAAELARRAEANGCRAIVVVGGDGTVNEAIGGMTGNAAPVLVVPAGTENILAKYFRTRMDAAWFRDVILAGHTTLLDVPTANERRFLMVSGVGFDAECVRRVAMARTGRITYANYFLPIWRAFWSYKQPHLRVEVEGERVFDGLGLAIVGNVSRYAWGLQPAQRARPDDGLLDVIVYPCSWQGPLLVHATKTVLGCHVNGAGVVYRQARHIRITAVTETGVEIDGDWGGVTPVDYRMTDRRVRFLVGREFLEQGGRMGRRSASRT